MSSPESENTPTLTSAGRVAVVAILILVVGGGITWGAIKFGRKAEEAD